MQEQFTSNGNWIDQAIADQHTERGEALTLANPESKELVDLASQIAENALFITLKGRELAVNKYELAA